MNPAGEPQSAGDAAPGPALPEPWLRGPVHGVPALLMPAAHALLQVIEDVERAAVPLTPTQLWTRPGGAASVGFHLRHLAASTDRLLTYARGEPLTPEQLATLAAESAPGDPPATALELVTNAVRALLGAVETLRRTPVDALDAPRTVGRAGLPTTVLGLLFHTAEHAQRHGGQVVTTAKIIRGLGLGATH